MTYYKLTDNKGQTHRGTQWGEGVRHEAIGKGWAFCSTDLIHLYDDPLLAVLFDPIHGGYGEDALLRKGEDALLWEAEAEGEVVSDNGTKYGAKVVTTIRQVEKPPITLTQRVAFGILAAKEAYTDSRWVKWANEWLDGTNRTSDAAAAADSAARAACLACAAADAAAAASHTVDTDAYAVTYAAARAADAAAAADSAARAACLACAAADAAAYAAATAARTKEIDLKRLAQQALKY